MGVLTAAAAFSFLFCLGGEMEDFLLTLLVGARLGELVLEVLGELVLGVPVLEVLGELVLEVLGVPSSVTAFLGAGVLGSTGVFRAVLSLP